MPGGLRPSRARSACSGWGAIQHGSAAGISPAEQHDEQTWPEGMQQGPEQSRRASALAAFAGTICGEAAWSAIVVAALCPCPAWALAADGISETPIITIAAASQSARCRSRVITRMT